MTPRTGRPRGRPRTNPERWAREERRRQRRERLKHHRSTPYHTLRIEMLCRMAEHDANRRTKED